MHHKENAMFYVIGKKKEDNVETIKGMNRK